MDYISNNSILRNKYFKQIFSKNSLNPKFLFEVRYFYCRHYKIKELLLKLFPKKIFVAHNSSWNFFCVRKNGKIEVNLKN